MPTDTEIWNAACERVGLVKHRVRCGRGGTLVTTDVPAIGDPAARCAMEDWLLDIAWNGRIVLWKEPKRYLVQGVTADSLPLALAAAVLAVKE